MNEDQGGLPDIYEQYFLYLAHTREISQSHITSVKRVLASLHNYLESHKLNLAALKIEHLDAFMGEFKVAKTTLRIYRYHVRGFLKYLYAEKKIIKKDLASLLVGPPLFAHKKPPKFLRPQEVQKLFSSLKLVTSVDIRTYAMIHLAYTLGIRPTEISRTTLDHISLGNSPSRKEKPKIRPFCLYPNKPLKLWPLMFIRPGPKHSTDTSL